MTGESSTSRSPRASCTNVSDTRLLDDGDSESLGTYVFTSEAGAVVTIYCRAHDVWSLLTKLFKRSLWRGNKVCERRVGAEQPEVAQSFCGWLSGMVSIEANPRPQTARVHAAQAQSNANGGLL